MCVCMCVCGSWSIDDAVVFMNSIDSLFSFFPYFRQKEWMALELCWIFLRSLEPL